SCRCGGGGGGRYVGGGGGPTRVSGRGIGRPDGSTSKGPSTNVRRGSGMFRGQNCAMDRFVCSRNVRSPTRSSRCPIDHFFIIASTAASDASPCGRKSVILEASSDDFA